MWRTEVRKLLHLNDHGSPTIYSKVDYQNIVFRYTEHSTVGLAQQWDQIDQLNMRMQKNLEHQIRAKNMTGVADETLKEFNTMFKYVFHYEWKNFGLVLNRVLDL